jgi:hypothetical protein
MASSLSPRANAAVTFMYTAAGSSRASGASPVDGGILGAGRRLTCAHSWLERRVSDIPPCDQLSNALLGNPDRSMTLDTYHGLLHDCITARVGAPTDFGSAVRDENRLTHSLAAAKLRRLY